MIRLLVAGDPGGRARIEPLLRQSSGLEIASSTSDWARVPALTDERDIEAVVALVDGGPDDLPDELTTAQVPLVLLIEDNQPAWLTEATRPGAHPRAILPRDATAQELSAAITAVCAGLSVWHPQLTATPVRVESTLLSPRETQVLRMVADGLANKEIAYRLGISEHTAKFHVASILDKLGASTRAEAVTAGIRRGVVLV